MISVEKEVSNNSQTW